MNEQYTLFADNPEYDAFVEKFKPKKTTDDCYTPPLVYDAVRDWACEQYGIDHQKIIRPFYPGGDYERFDYPEGCVVLDNPPFSILSKICEFYISKEIPFFLFAPSLTAFGGKNVCMEMNHIICDANIIYENGAVVRTAFVTSFGGDLVAQTAPDLTKRIEEAMAETLRTTKAPPLPRYTYPDHVLTASMLQRYSKYGIEFNVRRSECVRVSALDQQRTEKKAIFGSGLLLSDSKAAERAAAERAAAERAAAHVWSLSARELRMIQELDAGRNLDEQA